MYYKNNILLRRIKIITICLWSNLEESSFIVIIVVQGIFIVKQLYVKRLKKLE